MDDSLTICLSTNSFKNSVKQLPYSNSNADLASRKEPQNFSKNPPQQDFAKNIRAENSMEIKSFKCVETTPTNLDGLSVIEFDEQHKRKSQAGILGNSIYLDSNLILGKLVDTIGTLHVNLATQYKKLSDIYTITSKIAAKKKKILKNANSQSFRNNCEIYGENGVYVLKKSKAMYRKQRLTLTDIFGCLSVLERPDSASDIFIQAQTLSELEETVCNNFATLMLSPVICALRTKIFVTFSNIIVEGDHTKNVKVANKLETIMESSRKYSEEGKKIRAEATNIYNKLKPLHEQLDTQSNRTDIKSFLTKRFRVCQHNVPVNGIESEEALALIKKTFTLTFFECYGNSEPTIEKILNGSFGQRLKNNFSHATIQKQEYTLRWNVQEN
jgi:hypothetical protein